ncbi:MAG: hypothetical protein ACJAVA_000297 [Flavobacteriaceae bacterium]|jgi:hypothetical protein
MKKEQLKSNTEFVAVGKDFLSIQRAEIRSQELIKKGYQCTFSNGKRRTFTKIN